jgi:DNA-binding response OmpR family regulator
VVIDDSITVRAIMETTHRRCGFALQTFADGVEALQWFQRHATVIPSLIYLDVCLPRMDGYDVARHFRRCPRLATVPIVMLSGRDGVLDRLKGRLAGAHGYLTKPFRGEEIVQHTLCYVSTGQALSARSWKNEPPAGGQRFCTSGSRSFWPINSMQW